MIEVTALCGLKKISQKTANRRESKVIYIFEAGSQYHESWIDPLLADNFYEAKEEMHFTAGTQQEFERWRSTLAQLVHGKELSLYLAQARATDVLFPLLACQPSETIFGSTVCKRLREDLTNSWAVVLNFLERESFDTTSWFVAKYMAWLKAMQFAEQKGCIELF